MNPNVYNCPSSEWPNIRLDEKLEFEKLKVMLQNDKTTNEQVQWISYGNRTRDENNYLKI